VGLLRNLFELSSSHHIRACVIGERRSRHAVGEQGITLTPLFTDAREMRGTPLFTDTREWYEKLVSKFLKQQVINLAGLAFY
jgi:hypothetical protein